MLDEEAAQPKVECELLRAVLPLLEEEWCLVGWSKVACCLPLEVRAPS